MEGSWRGAGAVWKGRRGAGGELKPERELKGGGARGELKGRRAERQGSWKEAVREET